MVNHQKNTTARELAPRIGFTLVEMLVVVAIIVTLVAITVPVLNFARRTACRMAGQSQITALDSSIRNYFLDQIPNAYPPIWSNWAQCDDSALPVNAIRQNPPNSGVMTFGGMPTDSEFLVITLLGGMVPPAPGSGRSDRSWVGYNDTSTPTIWSTQRPPCYDPFAVGRGPIAGPGVVFPPLRQLDCYYKYKADELQDFDGNGMYEFKDKGFLSMPVLYYKGCGLARNGPKYFNGWTHTYYKVNQDGTPYDPRNFSAGTILVDDPNRSYKHFLKNAGGVNNSEKPFNIYVRTWAGAGSGNNGDLTGGNLPNNGDYILFSAGPDGYFGPLASAVTRANGTLLDAGLLADQPVIRQAIVDCDDVTSWNRK